MNTPKLPPLPKPDTHCFDEDTGKDVWSHSPEQMQAYATAATEPLLQQIAELERQLEEARKDAERWKMTIEISQDVLRHPDCRKIPSSVSAYMYALHKGYDMTYAVDTAIDEAMQKGQS